MTKDRRHKILLTSEGFETQAIREAFVAFVGKAPRDMKVLFIPTAANFPAAIEMVPKCMDDLLNLGIPAGDITVFDMHKSLSVEELSVFDAIYFTGGSPDYLLARINDTGFNKTLHTFVDNGGVYVGVSAGSIVAAGNLPNSLGFLQASLRVHCKSGTESGLFDNNAVKQIDLTNNAVMINGDEYSIL